MRIEFIPLKERVTKNTFQELVRLDEIAFSKYGRTFSSHPWTSEEFKLELPRKYELSVLAVFDNKIVGYFIASQKGEYIYMHRILTTRISGINSYAKTLVQHFEKNVSLPKVGQIYQYHETSLALFNSLGYQLVHEEDYCAKNDLFKGAISTKRGYLLRTNNLFIIKN